MKKALLIGLLLANSYLFAQNVGVNTNTPNAGAALDVKSAAGVSQGVLIPRVSLSSVTVWGLAGTAEDGMIVYNTNAAITGGYGVGFYFWGTTIWNKVAEGNVLKANLTNGKIWIGDASNLPTEQTMIGDVTIDNAGVTTIGNDKVTSAKILDGTIATADIANNAVDGTKINITSNANGDLMYYDGTDWVRLAAGTSGQMLQTTGAGAPVWIDKSAIIKSQNGLTTVTTGGSATATSPYVELGGSLYKATTITQGANTLSFTSTATNGFSVDGTTFSVDAANDRVGIGTTAPNYLLTLGGGNQGVFAINNMSQFLAKNATGTYETYFWPRWSDNIMYMNFGAGGFRLRNNGSADAISIDNSNNVGIPSITGYKLTASGDIYANGGWLRVSGNNGLYFESHGTGIRSVESVGGTYGSVSTYGNENGWDGYSLQGKYVFMGDNANQCGIYNDVDNYWYMLMDRLATNNGFRFFNSYTGALNMRIQHTNGSNYASYDGDNNWDFYSDKRLKENIQKEGNILNRLIKLDVVNYDFINQERKYKEIGLIAQDVEPYFPSLVTETTDDRYDFKVKALGYSSFGVLAVGAIKELKIEKDKEIDSLNKKIEELTNEIVQLKATQIASSENAQLKSEIDGLKKMLLELEKKVNTK